MARIAKAREQAFVERRAASAGRTRSCAAAWRSPIRSSPGSARNRLAAGRAACRSGGARLRRRGTSPSRADVASATASCGGSSFPGSASSGPCVENISHINDSFDNRWLSLRRNSRFSAMTPRELQRRLGLVDPPPPRAPEVQPGRFRRRRGHPPDLLRQHRARHAELLDRVPAQDLADAERAAFDAVRRSRDARSAERGARAAFAAAGRAAAGAEVALAGVRVGLGARGAFF